MEHPDNQGNCAVLIVSCDKYKDLWGPCITLFRRFWNDCPYPVYLLSNTVQADFPNVTSILTGDDLSWSDNLQFALHTIQSEYVLLYIEDLFLVNPVESQSIHSLIERCIYEQWNYLRLNPTPKGDILIDTHISEISPGSVYRSSVVFSVWRSETLQRILKSGESAWDFEEIGTERTDAFPLFFASNQELIPAYNTVIKGVWELDALKKIQSLGINPDLTSRRAMSMREYILWKLKQLRSLFFHLMPHASKRSIRSFFR
ncbi:MAG: hypothetical protein ACKOX1_08170 [Ignavibacteria bacterium]